MPLVKRPLGFADLQTTCEFFQLTKEEVMDRVLSGVWPSYVVNRKRLFDLDLLVQKLAQQGKEDQAGE